MHTDHSALHRALANSLGIQYMRVEAIETHFLSDCTAIASARLRILGKPAFEYIKEISCCILWELVSFMIATDWLGRSEQAGLCLLAFVGSNRRTLAPILDLQQGHHFYYRAPQYTSLSLVIQLHTLGVFRHYRYCHFIWKNSQSCLVCKNTEYLSRLDSLLAIFTAIMVSGIKMTHDSANWNSGAATDAYLTAYDVLFLIWS